MSRSFDFQVFGQIKKPLYANQAKLKIRVINSLLSKASRRVRNKSL